MVRPVRERVHKARSLHTKQLPLGGDVFPGQARGVQAPGPHDGRAAIGVALDIIDKMPFVVDALAAPFADRISQKLDMGSDPSLVTLNQVARVAVGRIGDHGSQSLIGAIFMSFN